MNRENEVFTGLATWSSEMLSKSKKSGLCKLLLLYIVLYSYRLFISKPVLKKKKNLSLFAICVCMYMSTSSVDLKNSGRVDVRTTVTLTVAKVHFVPCPLFAGGRTFIPCQKAGDHLEEQKETEWR